MALYVTLHLHNVPPGREADYAAWFDGPHRIALAGIAGFRTADRYEVTPEQVMAEIAQPWRYCSLYDCETDQPELDIPLLDPLLADARDHGLIATSDDSERLFTYRLSADWKGSGNWRHNRPLSGMSVLIGNYVAGRHAEYEDWYERVHTVEVAAVPGHVATRRGVLSDVQVAPRHFCPGDQLVHVAMQTDDLAFTVKDFQARATGRSPSGVAMEPRSKSGSFARTVHYFRKISGTEFWDGGIAYDGDLSVYPEGFGQ